MVAPRSEMVRHNKEKWMMHPYHRFDRFATHLRVVATLGEEPEIDLGLV
jgi:hypothetical protein